MQRQGHMTKLVQLFHGIPDLILLPGQRIAHGVEGRDERLEFTGSFVVDLIPQFTLGNPVCCIQQFINRLGNAAG